MYYQMSTAQLSAILSDLNVLTLPIYYHHERSNIRNTTKYHQTYKKHASLPFQHNKAWRKGHHYAFFYCNSTERNICFLFQISQCYPQRRVNKLTSQDWFRLWPGPKYPTNYFQIFCWFTSVPDMYTTRSQRVKFGVIGSNYFWTTHIYYQIIYQILH